MPDSTGPLLEALIKSLTEITSKRYEVMKKIDAMRNGETNNRNQYYDLDKRLCDLNQISHAIHDVIEFYNEKKVKEAA